MKILNDYNDIKNIKVKKISAKQFISTWISIKQGYCNDKVLLDVRSEKEFLSKNLPSFISAPLLKDEEHSLIGTLYKQKGPSIAMKEGLKLSELYLKERLSTWKNITDSKEVFITCLRGGLRSRIVAHYVQFFTKSCYQIEGGYKALRSILLEQLKYLEKYNFYILTGKTGSGKTQLLNKLSIDIDGIIDLEKLANHKGSAFGYPIYQNQPTQSSFENALLFELLQKKSHCILLEDESRLIGQNLIPPQIKEKMNNSPVVYLDVDIDTRAKHIFKEYIIDLMQQDISKDTLFQHALEGLKRISKRLGGNMFQSLKKSMNHAFSQDQGMNEKAHLEYIRTLLETYYDKRYDHAFNKNKRKVLFQGNFKECRKWLTVSLKLSSSHKQLRKEDVPQNSLQKNSNLF